MKIKRKYKVKNEVKYEEIEVKVIKEYDKYILVEYPQRI